MGEYMYYSFVSKSKEETIEFGKSLIPFLFRGSVITLTGDLGAGKTTLSSGIAKGLNITDKVSSPTFNIIKEYIGELPLYHIDVYRTNGKIDNLGIEEYFDKGGVTIIEWAEMIEDVLPLERLDITFKITGENSRVMLITPHGEKYVRVCEDAL